MSSTGASTAPYVPSRRPPTDFPLIDEDPHISRVWRYMRPMDYAVGAGVAATPPAGLLAMEYFSPTFTKGVFAPVLRLNAFLGLGGGLIIMHTRSVHRFLGLRENQREIDMDMREMVDKVKRGEPLYGKSSLSADQQAMAARNSRNSVFLLAVLPWFNAVNHPYHGVDTAKYYQQAERELEEERVLREGS